MNQISFEDLFEEEKEKVEVAEIPKTFIALAKRYFGII